MLRRPTEVYVDYQRCIGCGICEQIVPGILAAPEPVNETLGKPLVRSFPVTDLLLDAMAACPTAAIRWREFTSEEFASTEGTATENTATENTSGGETA